MYILPPRSGEIAIELNDFKIITLLGANGSGKTRFSVYLEDKWDNIHRISAQKSLNMPDSVGTKTKEEALDEFYYGFSEKEADREWVRKYGKHNRRWGGNPNTHLLSDYSQLLILLHTEEYEAAVKFKDEYQREENPEKPITKLDLVQKMWEEVLPHRKIKKAAGKLETYPTGKPEISYNSSEMSDGERLVFYFIGAVVCSPADSIIIIDEPENHLHRSIIKLLWDRIEQSRPDCKFIYLTHDIEFAVSRNSSCTLWIKSYESDNIWDYQEVTDIDSIPSEVYLEILGSRKPVLFVEGDKSSYDYYIYNKLFANYTIMPLGSGHKVIEATKAFNSLAHLHNLHAKGIIDRDRKSDEEINTYKAHGIYAPSVAEVENLFLLEDVVKIISRRLACDNQVVWSSVKENVVKAFHDQIEKQAFQYATYSIENATNQIINGRYSDFDTFQSAYLSMIENNRNQAIFQEMKSRFEEYVAQNDYTSIIKVFNHKGLIGQSNVAKLCGLLSKRYIELVKDILKEESHEGELLIAAMKAYVMIE